MLAAFKLGWPLIAEQTECDAIVRDSQASVPMVGCYRRLWALPKSGLAIPNARLSMELADGWARIANVIGELSAENANREPVLDIALLLSSRFASSASAQLAMPCPADPTFKIACAANSKRLPSACQNHRLYRR